MNTHTFTWINRQRFRPPACPRCHAVPLTHWTKAATTGDPDAWRPGRFECRTKSCPGGDTDEWLHKQAVEPAQPVGQP